jgi:hypothetical protein
MVSLNHQKFWRPAPRISATFSPVDEENHAIEEERQAKAPDEKCQAKGYFLENSMLQEEYSTERVGKACHNYLPFSLFKTNVVFPASGSHIISRATSPGVCHDDTLSISGNSPDYPEEVGLYPPFRASDTPSVTGLEGPGMTRVFDVFQDDRSEQNGGEDCRYPSPNKRKRVSGNSRTPLKKDTTMKLLPLQL